VKGKEDGVGKVIPFYSLLGVSLYNHSVSALITEACVHLSTPFWEFRALGQCLSCHSQRYWHTFLLPFGSFQGLEYIVVATLPHKKLSTPFWEFRRISQLIAVDIEKYTSFYSLLGVSTLRKRWGFLQRLELSTPFWEFRWVPGEVATILLNASPFYSLLGVSPEPRAQLWLWGQLILSTPFWEFQAPEGD